VTSAHSTGYKVVGATILPCTTGSFTGAMETERGTYNTAMRGNAAGADQVVDIADTGTTMGALTAPNNAIAISGQHPPIDAGLFVPCSGVGGEDQPTDLAPLHQRVDDARYDPCDRKHGQELESLSPHQSVISM
jgi:hypothetical protein